MILQNQGQLEQARERYERVLAIDPRAAVAANNLAWMQAEAAQNLDVALQLAQTAVSASPDAPEIRDTLGWIYYKKNLPESAIPQFARSIARDPNNPTYHYHIGLAYLKAGDHERAMSAFERALATKADAKMAADIKRLLPQVRATSSSN
jgi:tetratricopeptide (TPR) repeat protein